MLRKLLLATLSWLLIMSLTLSLLGFASQQLLYPEPYEQALEDNDAYKELNDKAGLGIYGEAIAKNATRTIIRQTLKYLRGEADTLSVVLSVKDAASAIDSIPECEQGQRPTMESPCLPPGTDKGALQALIGQELPKEVNLTATIAKSPETVQQLENAREYISYGQLAVRALLALSFVLALLILFVARHHILGGVRMLETDLLVVGASAAGSAYLVGTQVSQVMPAELGALGGVASDVMMVVLDTMLLYGGVLAAAGLVTLVFSSVITIEHKR